MATDRKKGHFTFRTAAVLLMASAAWELLSITSEVPLFGEIRGGISAGISHLVYAALFLALGTFIKARMSGFESQLQSQGIDETLITQAIVLMAVVVVLCWWGFALYTWWRRDYFKDNG